MSPIEMNVPENNAKIFEYNRQKLIGRLPDNSTTILFSAERKIRSGDTEYPFCQDKNLYYLTGLELPDSTFVIFKQKSSATVILFVETISEKKAHWFGYRPGISEISRHTGIHCRESKDNLPEFLSKCLNDSELCFIDYTSESAFGPLSARQQFAFQLKQRYPHLNIKPLTPIISKLREIKEDWEIERIRKAIRITKSGIFHALSHMKPGIRELSLEAYFNLELHLQGCVPAFQSIVAAGKNATVLHYQPGSERLAADELVLFDVGAEFRHYSADISRTYPVNGKLNSLAKDVYEIVLEANKAVISDVKPGKTLTELHETANRTMEPMLREIKILKQGERISKYFTHHVSHMLGLFTHDLFTDMNNKLKPNMVFTVEPGLYIPEHGIGVRIEDDVCVTPDGAINLSAEIPKEISEIESLINT